MTRIKLGSKMRLMTCFVSLTTCVAMQVTTAQADTLLTSPPPSSAFSASFSVLSSEPPEYGRCVKVEEGNFSSSTCTKEGGTEHWEWLPATGEPLHFALSGGSATYATVGGSTLTCTGMSGSGELVGPKELANISSIAKGCSSSGFSCETAGAGIGEIVSEQQEGLIGWENQALGRVALDVGDQSGESLSVNCVGLWTATRGSIIVPIKDGKMASVYTLKYSASKGKQKPEHLDGAPKDTLETSKEGQPYAQAGVTETDSQTFEEPIEINAVF